MDSTAVISVLIWALGIVGTGFVALLVWFALRIVAQLDRLEELFSDRTSQLDRRVLSLEEWRKTVGMRPRSNSTETSAP